MNVKMQLKKHSPVTEENKELKVRDRQIQRLKRTIVIGENLTIQMLFRCF